MGAAGRGLACMGAKAGALRMDADGLAAAPALDAPEAVGREDVAAAAGVALNLLKTSSMGSRRRRWTSLSRPSSKWKRCSCR